MDREDMSQNADAPEANSRKASDTPSADREFFRNGGTAAARAAATRKLQQSVRDRDDAGAREAMQGLAALLREDVAGQRALAKWTDGRRESGARSDEEQARRDRNAGIFTTEDEEPVDEPASEEPASEEESWEDEPWNKPGAVNRSEPDENVDPFEQHRRGKSHDLEAPKDVHWLDDGAIKDLGFVTAQMNVPQEVAQALIGNYVLASEKERAALRAGGGSYDAERTLGELRAEWGSDLEPIHEKIVKFTTSHPALADYLDSTGLGSSPEVVRMLMGAATVGTTRAQARAFIDKVKKDPKHGYWHGSKLALAQMRFAFTLAGEDA